MKKPWIIVNNGHGGILASNNTFYQCFHDKTLHYSSDKKAITAFKKRFKFHPSLIERVTFVNIENNPKWYEDFR